MKSEIVSRTKTFRPFHKQILNEVPDMIIMWFDIELLYHPITLVVITFKN